MGKIITTLIDKFDGGLTNDLRSKSANKFGLTKHFDTFTYPHKLKPYHQTVAAENKTYSIIDFIYAPRATDDSSYKLFGFGKDGSGKVAIYMLNSDGDDWDIPANNASSLARSSIYGASNYGRCFFHYRRKTANEDYLYMWATNGKLLGFNTDSGAAFDDDVVATLGGAAVASFSYVVQPVHHLADDIAYFFTDNFVHTLNDATWITNALTLPKHLKIVAACSYGTYLAIGCVTKGGSDSHSFIYIWDRDSSLTTVTAIIDLGRGILKHLVNLNGKLIAIMEYFINSSFSLDKGRLLIKQATTNGVILLNEIIVDDAIDTTSAIPSYEFVKNNKLYFPASLPLNGDTRNGIWAVEENGKIILDFVEEEVDNAVAKTYQGIYQLAETWIIAHSADGSVNISDLTKVYSATLASVYESLIFNSGDSSLTKKLIGVEVMYEPLPSAGQVTLKYRKDGDLDGSWTTVFTDSANDSISHGAINIESSGVNFPQYKEIQFRIESTGGAVITGLKFKEEIIDKSLF